MGSLDWLYPSVLAGSLRTILGNIVQADFSKQETIDALKKVAISGPLPLWNGKIFLPAPKDIIVKEDGKDSIKKRYAYAIRPTKIQNSEGCDLPFPRGVLCPAMLPIQDEFKPAGIPAFWSANKIAEWLVSPNGECFLVPPGPEKPETIKTVGEFLPNPQKDTRTHVKIDPKLGSAEDEMLFRTIGLDLSLKSKPQGIQFAVRVEADGVFLGDKPLEALVKEIDCFGPIGGERRLARWKSEKPENRVSSAEMRSQESEGPQIGWNFSKKICDALDKQKNGKERVRLILATPAVFSQGWLPGWLEFNGGSIESTSENDVMPPGVKLKLVSACFDRWRPISGWSLEKDHRGPKKIRRLVPSGSVYFFDVLKGDASDLAKNLWLRSVCDDKQDRRDGFGLALWGIWDYANETIVKKQE
jgi:CRISPR-associated protein Cmr3